MAHVIEWDITDPKDDYTQHHSHQIKGAFKLMAPPLHPIIIPGHLDSYLPVSSRISHWWFIMIAAANGSAGKANCLSLYQTVDYKSSYQLVQLIHQYSLCNLCFCPSRLCCIPLISSVSLLFPLSSSHFLFLSLPSFSFFFRWCVSAVTGNYSGGQKPQWCRDVSPLIHLQRDVQCVCVNERVSVCVCLCIVSLSPFAKALLAICS